MASDSLRPLRAARTILRWSLAVLVTIALVLTARNLFLLERSLPPARAAAVEAAGFSGDAEALYGAVADSMRFHLQALSVATAANPQNPAIPALQRQAERWSARMAPVMSYRMLSSHADRYRGYGWMALVLLLGLLTALVAGPRILQTIRAVARR